jgi:hypothetical protein
MGKNKMIKLTNILNEIKVVQPVNKMKAFKDMLEFDEGILTYLIQYDTLNDFMDEYGYDSLEELLEDNYGIDDPQSYTPYITNYFNYIKPGDITIIGENITPITGYKNAIEIVRDSGDRCLDRYFIALKF